MSQETLGEIRGGQRTLGEVRNESEDPWGGPGRVGGFSGSSGRDVDPRGGPR